MKKLLLVGTLCLLNATIAQADTISGKVVNTDKNTITLRTENGEKMIFHTTDNTNYRKKKLLHKGKTTSDDFYYQPMVEEDDWIEITYTPQRNNIQTAEVQDVIVYDD